MKGFYLVSLLSTLVTTSLSQSLSLSPSSISLSSASKDRTYSLEQTNNLLDSNSWNQVDNQRGTNSNLTFSITQDNPISFYRTVSSYSPVDSPIALELNKNPQQAYPTVVPFTIENFTTNSLRARIQYEEIQNPYGLTYSNSLTRAITNTLSVGKTTMNDTAYWNGNTKQGTVYGQINVEVVK